MTFDMGQLTTDIEGAPVSCELSHVKRQMYLTRLPSYQPTKLSVSPNNVPKSSKDRSFFSTASTGLRSRGHNPASHTTERQ